MRRIVVLPAALLAALIACTLPYNPNAGPVGISGTVTNASTGRPLGSLLVELLVCREGACQAAVRTLTDSSGQYLLTGLAPGEYQLTITWQAAVNCGFPEDTRSQFSGEFFVSYAPDLASSLTTAIAQHPVRYMEGDRLVRDLSLECPASLNVDQDTIPAVLEGQEAVQPPTVTEPPAAQGTPETLPATLTPSDAMVEEPPLRTPVVAPAVAREDYPVPDVAYTTVDGDTLYLADLSGRWVMVLFYEDLCRDVCGRVLDQLGIVARENPGRTAVVALNVDQNSSADSLREFLAYTQADEVAVEAGFPFYVARPAEGDDLRVVFSIRTLPYMILVNRSGILWYVSGQYWASPNEMRTLIGSS